MPPRGLLSSISSNAKGRLSQCFYVDRRVALCLTYSDEWGSVSPMKVDDSHAPAGMLAAVPLPVSGTYSRSAESKRGFSVIERWPP